MKPPYSSHFQVIECLRTDQRLVELLATIGHEFGTPLTIIDGSTTARHTKLRPERETW
jgi:signal transduction histidine kinase